MQRTNGLTKQVLETALEAEMTEHLGPEKHGQAEGGNIRNGTRSKTVLTEVSAVRIDVPPDWDGSFEPKVLKQRQRRLTGVDEIVLSLTVRGLTTGEVAARFDDVDGASVSKDISTPVSRTPGRKIEVQSPGALIDVVVRAVDEGEPVRWWSARGVLKDHWVRVRTARRKQPSER